MKKYLGIDIGGTEIKYGIYDEFGKEYESHTTASVQDNLSQILDILFNIINQYKEVEGIGLSIPGGVNSDTGFIIEGGACSALNQLDLISLLKQKTSLPIALENDANCAALAEQWLGNGKECKNFVCLTIGTGIGGGIIINHNLFTGSHYFAGEFGYMQDNRCRNLSYTASTSRLVKDVKKIIHDNNIDGRKIFQMLDQGNELVLEVYKKWIHTLTVGIYNIGTCFDPDKVLIGGGVSNQERLMNDIQNELKNVQEYEVEWKVEPCLCRNNAGKIGAIYNLMRREKM